MELRKFLNILFPVKCVCCQKVSERAQGEDILCRKCREIIDESAGYDCMSCKKPPPLCRCKKIEHISGVLFAYFYSGEKLKQAIYKLKRANLRYVNEFFAKGMFESLKADDAIKRVDFIAYAPRMKSSVRFYGYNQSKALAKLISKYSGIPCLPALKVSGSHKTEQKSLTRAKRGQNVKNKYIVRGNVKKSGKLMGKDIILIDDVVTTGSTLSECAKIMKNAGAKDIYALCAASVVS